MNNSIIHDFVWEDQSSKYTRLSKIFEAHKKLIKQKFGHREIFIGESVQNKTMLFFLKKLFDTMKPRPQIIWVFSGFKTPIPDVELVIFTTMGSWGDIFLLAGAFVWKKRSNQSFRSIFQHFIKDWDFVEPSVVIWNYDKRILEAYNERFANNSKLIISSETVKQELISIINENTKIPPQLVEEVIKLINISADMESERNFKLIWEDIKNKVFWFLWKPEIEIFENYYSLYRYWVRGFVDRIDYHWEMISLQFFEWIFDVVKNKIWHSQNSTPLKIIESFEENMMFKMQFENTELQDEKWKKILVQVSTQIHNVGLNALYRQMELMKVWNLCKDYYNKGDKNAMEENKKVDRNLNSLIGWVSEGVFYRINTSNITDCSWKLKDIQGYPCHHLLKFLEFSESFDSISIIKLFDSAKWHISGKTSDHWILPSLNILDIANKEKVISYEDMKKNDIILSSKQDGNSSLQGSTTVSQGKSQQSDPISQK